VALVQNPHTPSAAPREAITTMTARILLVEDDPGVRSLMVALLGDAGYQTRTLAEGGQAYAIIRQERPDLVILDIQLERPELGWTILDVLRLDRVTARIPVIICSADHPFLQRHTPDLLAVGCCILEKPFTIDQFLRLVQLALAGTVGRPD
jgi:CheY-like chemotaxis protein